MENPQDTQDGAFDKLKKIVKQVPGRFGETGTQREYAKNPLAVVGFWLMTALATVLALMYYDKNNEVKRANARAVEAERLLIIERAKRDADTENNVKRVEYWINKTLETVKESAKKEQLNELNK